MIVNPIAGMGGAVGLKGTDGDLVVRARELGARPQASLRAKQALQVLAGCAHPPRVLACAGAMGEDVAREVGLRTEVVHHPSAAESGAADTRAAAERMLALQPDLLMFVGGDGTARNVLEAVGAGMPVLGVPAGVKMHSGVFAVTAKTAGDVARAYLESATPETLLDDMEVMDREPLPGGGISASPRLYGTMRVPRVPRLVQAAKAGNPVSDGAALAGACERAAREAARYDVALVGPGSTMRAVKTQLGDAGTLLGVDVYSAGRCIARDAGEQELLALIDGRSACIVITVIGGQGFLFGRGNQQLGPEVLRRVGRDALLVVASPAKLVTLPDGVLWVDTGAEDTDAMLAGQLPVLTGHRRTMMCRVADVNAGSDGY